MYKSCRTTGGWLITECFRTWYTGTRVVLLMTLSSCGLLTQNILLLGLRSIYCTWHNFCRGILENKIGKDKNNTFKLSLDISYRPCAHIRIHYPNCKVEFQWITKVISIILHGSIVKIGVSKLVWK